MKRRSSKIIFMFGPGGVGKTTLSSALGISLAAEGLDTLIVTVDPARRLKDILRLKEMGFEPVSLKKYFRQETGREIEGRLDAMMIDSENAFLNLLKRYIKDENLIERVVSNRIFRFLSDSVIGAQEYFAAEKIYDIFLMGEYDVIVVDTAPSKNAFEFIDGAGKMAGFLDKKVIRFFVDVPDSESITNLFFRKTGDFLYKVLGIVFGSEFIADMRDFLGSISDMYEGLLKRAYELGALYLSDNVRYCIIGSPQKLCMGELSHLQKGLRQRGISDITVVINRAPYFYGREAMAEEINMIMTKCENSDIKANLEFILGMEMEMLESVKRDMANQSEISGVRNKVVLPDLYTDISGFDQLLKLGDRLRGGIRL
ncbi:MAG: AAA family ATPase [Deltaproteobacteria bacterium]|nr:AAA family ATPase [Deltaproteobacteria bacterium]